MIGLRAESLLSAAVHRFGKASFDEDTRGSGSLQCRYETFGGFLIESGNAWILWDGKS